MASEPEHDVEDSQVTDDSAMSDTPVEEDKTNLLAKGILGILAPAVEKVDEKIDAVRYQFY